MHALEIDVLRGPSQPRWAMWLLLALALAFAFDTTRHYFSLQEQLAVKRARLARATAQVSQPSKQIQPADAEEYKFARQVISRLALPWEQLFRSLEAARTDDLALLEVAPDPSTGAVMLSGEAPSYLAVLTYAARLAEQPELREVRLARHEIKNDGKTWLFGISASWQADR